MSTDNLALAERLEAAAAFKTGARIVDVIELFSLAARALRESAQRETDGFRRGVEAAEKACAIPHYMAAICAANIRALLPPPTGIL